MKLLVIGGSYFYGRVFVMQAAGDHEVTVVNRGTYSMAGLGVKEVKGDRKDEALWRAMEEDYDVIVDFCAYEKGDIARVLRNMPGKARQYIFISTVDVYQRGKNSAFDGAGSGIKQEMAAGMTEESAALGKNEETAFETRVFPGEAGRYIAGKVALEQEIREECAARGIDYTVLRPAVLYGPFNYAPREPAYIQMIVQNHVLPHIKDADGKFQMLYVKDGALAIMKCLLNEKAYGQAYNLCQDEIMTYDSFYEALKKAAETGTEELSVTAGEAESMGIPLPFPVTEEETELYSNEKSKRELGMSYMNLSEGMKRTYRAFQGVYSAS